MKSKIYKYVVHNVAHCIRKNSYLYAKTISWRQRFRYARHQSIAKDGENLFAGDKYGGLSEDALYYIGGIIKHAQAINAFANASTNSYKRLSTWF